VPIEQQNLDFAHIRGENLQLNFFFKWDIAIAFLFFVIATTTTATAGRRSTFVN